MSWAITIYRAGSGVEVATASGMGHIPNGGVTFAGRLGAPGLGSAGYLGRIGGRIPASDDRPKRAWEFENASLRSGG